MFYCGVLKRFSIEFPSYWNVHMNENDLASNTDGSSLPLTWHPVTTKMYTEWNKVAQLFLGTIGRPVTIISVCL